MKTTPCTEKKTYAFDKAPRCGARTKSHNGLPCRSPAIKDKSRCPVHGGARGTGAPHGNMNAVKHGETIGEIKMFRIKVRQVIKASRELAPELS